MPADFDPYAQWLNIPADRRPPSHYDLLGLPEFESDLNRIRQSVLDRSVLVRRYQLGQRSQTAIQLLSELSLAFDTLTTPDRKREYDLLLAGTATQISGLDAVLAEAVPELVDDGDIPPVQLVEIELVTATLVEEPGSPFAPDNTSPLIELRPPKRRSVGRAIGASVRFVFRAPIVIFRALVGTVVFSVKACWWSVRSADRLMCKSLGEDNAILHNFLRFVFVGGLVCGLIATIWFWPQIAPLLEAPGS